MVQIQDYQPRETHRIQADKAPAEAKSTEVSLWGEYFPQRHFTSPGTMFAGITFHCALEKHFKG